ncbi:MAG: hypothetical protein ACI4TK_02580 [Agathobacter sp.]
MRYYVTVLLAVLKILLGFANVLLSLNSADYRLEKGRAVDIKTNGE